MRSRTTPRHADRGDPGPWLGRLRADSGYPGSGGDTRPEPEIALARPYLRPRGVPAVAAPEDTLPTLAPAPAPTPRPRHARAGGGRAVIGDELRRPVLWCQLGDCIARYADPQALGDTDNRARAVADGWREDVFGRFACPSCLQRSPEFRARYPVVPWDKDRAVAVALLMTAAARQHRRDHR